jgi:hypothetical protein
MTRTVSVAIVLALAVAVAAEAQLVNGRVEAHAAEAALAGQVRALASRAPGSAWVGYTVPVADEDAQMCCGTRNGCCVGCRLDPDAAQEMFINREMGATVRLVLDAEMTVLVRVSGGAIDRVRLFSADCAIDATGATVYWINGVTGTASVAWLESLAVASQPRRVADGALTALAMHAEPTAIDRLIALARTGGTTHLRGQALFWLSQRATASAVGAISEAIDKDPETDVKRRAVFALSQLPPDDGVPRLIEVARTHSNRAVRRQAMFWLGQSKDPRALDFFTEILKR